MARARLHGKWDDEEIFIAEVDASRLEPITLTTWVDGEVTHLPAWEDQEAGCIFLSIADLREYLWLDLDDWTGLSQRSEWFALDYIPGTMVSRIGEYSELSRRWRWYRA